MYPEELAGYDRVALLDVQPFHSPDIPTHVDLVIDHHPRRTNYTARIKDVRPRYGATSTIMTEYLLASDTPISSRLATALLYGIKTDTQLLGRDDYLVLADYQAYIDCQDRVDALFRDRKKWTQMSILNVARMGKFSSDRAIREYCEYIWHAPILQRS